MKIAAFSGSGNRNGNSAKLVRRILEGAESRGAEGQIYHLCEYDIKPCTGCRSCERTNVCVITGDDVPLLHRAVRESDAFILATPTYYGTVAGAFKQFVDRCYPFCTQHIDKERRVCSFGSILPPGKPGLLVAVTGGMGPEIFERHSNVAYHCFNDINVTYWRDVLVPYTTFEPVDETHEAWRRAYETGVELVRRFGA